MNWRAALTVSLALAAAATGWSIWTMSRPAEDGVLATRPDYVLRDYEITALDKLGAESFTLHGPVLQRDPADRTMQLQTPRFEIPDRHGSYWTVHAESGLVPAGADRLELSGQVRADSPPQAPPPTRIETERLTLLLRENGARTDAEVTITRPGLTMRGVGMQAWFDAQRVSLLSQVRNHYEPQH